MWCIHRNADVDVLLAHHLFAFHVQGHVELRQFRQRGGAGLEQERQRGHLHATLFAGRFLAFTEGFHFGDVGIVELGYVRHVQPAALHVGGGGCHHAGHTFTLDLTELAEVRQFHARNARASGYATALLGLLQLALHVGVDIVFHDPAFWA